MNRLIVQVNSNAITSQDIAVVAQYYIFSGKQVSEAV